MPRPYIITAIDIGTGSVKVLSILKKPGVSDFDVLGFHQEQTSGIRKGVVVEVHTVAKVTAQLLNKIQKEGSRRIEEAYVSVGGAHIFSVVSRGLVSVARADQKISQDDVDRVIQNARSFPLARNKEILEDFPKEFFVDGEGGVREPVGMKGNRLEAEVMMICGFSPYINNTREMAQLSGLSSIYLVPNMVASAKAVLTDREKELGVAVLDIGAGVSSLVLYQEGQIMHTAVFPVGSGNITNDIAICLRIDIDTAEKIKVEFGSCRGASPNEKGAKKDRKIRIEGDSAQLISRKTITDIVDARVTEIFDLVEKELKKVSKNSLLPGGIVLTGGGARLCGIVASAKRKLKLPVRTGIPQDFSLVSEEPDYAVLLGMLGQGVQDHEEKRGFASSSGGFMNKVKGFFREFIP